MNSAGAIEPLLTPSEAAKLLRIHRVTLLRFAREGRIPRVRLSKRKVLFRASELLAFCDTAYTVDAVRAAQPKGEGA